MLDEATAYADPENEEKMEAAIAELVKGKTLVAIAHKLPAVSYTHLDVYKRQGLHCVRKSGKPPFIPSLC